MGKPMGFPAIKFMTIEELFEVGNIIGIKNHYENRIYPTVITESTDLSDYFNDTMDCVSQVQSRDGIKLYTTRFSVEWVLQIDQDGNTRHLYQRSGCTMD